MRNRAEQLKSSTNTKESHREGGDLQSTDYDLTQECDVMTNG